jgi:hypothetical protein
MGHLPPPVAFDGESAAHAIEVEDDVAGDGNPSSGFEAGEASAAKDKPKPLLRVGRLVAHLHCKLEETPIMVTAEGHDGMTSMPVDGVKCGRPSPLPSPGVPGEGEDLLRPWINAKSQTQPW